MSDYLCRNCDYRTQGSMFCSTYYREAVSSNNHDWSYE